MQSPATPSVATTAAAVATAAASSPAAVPGGGKGREGKEEEIPNPAEIVDPFLVEALTNPRHRLTVLRMELDVQRFLQTPNLYQFEFQPFPTSYLRCCAHRVAQHYGLQTISLGSVIDGQGSRVLALKTPNCRLSSIFLAQVPVRPPQTESVDPIKVTIRRRSSSGSPSDSGESAKGNSARTVEQRKEDYDKARARIFGDLPILETERSPSPPVQMNRFQSSSLEGDGCKGTEVGENSKNTSGSRVAVFKDIAKDRNDPDFDRSYMRYTRSQAFGQNYGGVQACTLLPPYMCYDMGMPPFALSQMQSAPVDYNYPSMAFKPYCTYPCAQPKDGVQLQWPAPAMVNMSSFDNFSHTDFQAQFYQLPPSVEHTQYCL